MTSLTRICTAIGEFAVAVVVLAGITGQASADTVIGNWESASSEGWFDWGYAADPRATLEDSTRFDFNATGATLGTTAVQFTIPTPLTYTQWLAFKLQNGTYGPPDWANGIDDFRDDFMANTKLAVDITLVASEMAPVPTNDFAAIGMIVNADGYVNAAGNGFLSMGDPESVTPFTGYNGGNSFNPTLLVGTQTATWVWDISSTHDGDPLTPAAPRTPGEIAAAPNWVEIIFDTYSNGAVVYHVDNVRLFTPSPGGLQGDFDNNDVVDGADLTDRWKLGYGMTGQTDDSNGDADADGDVDGDDLLIWQRQLGMTAPVPVAAGVPEPSGAALGLVVAAASAGIRRRRKA